MYRLSLLLVALWTISVHGQDLLYSIGGGVGDSGLTSNCGSTFQSANAVRGNDSLFLAAMNFTLITVDGFLPSAAQRCTTK